MRLFVGAWAATALLLLLSATARLWRNLRFFRHARRRAVLPTPLPRVSVLVPARDEAATITACIESLTRQTYPEIEILVLDDQSTDGTGGLLDRLATQYANLTVIHGAEAPPPGWNGKSFACRRLAARASGDWLLFTDADTVHEPDSIARGVAQAAGLGADVLSALPHQLAQSWSERVLISFILDFLPLVAVDLAALWRGVSSTIAANGQYLLVSAAAYRAFGGHEAIAAALVDDFALARHARDNGYTVAPVDGTAMLRCRMYRSAGEVWRGFSKNVLLSLETAGDRRPWWWGPVFMWGYASIFVLPFALLFSRWRGPALLVIGWLGVLRGVVGWRLARPWAETATTPLAGWGLMGLGVSAWLQQRRGQPVRWKGRAYPLPR